MPDLSQAQLSGQMSALLVSWQAREDQYREWTGGTANGGPNADGRYQLTDSAGITRLVECPALLASTVSGPAAAALAHKLETIVARDVSISEATRASAQRVLSEAALAAAVLARNQAQLARDVAQNSESNAAVHAETASVAASSSTAAYLGTQADREATAADVVSADADRILAQAAATAAAADRAAINPVQFATRADGLSQIVGLQAALDAKLPLASFTWSGLAGKPSTFTPAAHVHDASDVTSGVFDIDRIPILPSQVQQMSSGDLTALTGPQQAAITSGTIVTTTDGSRYVYSGTGSKTLTTSYVLLADVTPDWNTISGKPSTFTPSAHSHVISDVTGLQTALDGKQAAGSYSLTSHVHDWSVITGKPSTFTPSAHSHVVADVTGLQAALDGRFNLSTSNVTSGTVKSTNDSNAAGANFWVDTTTKATGEYGFVVTRSNALVGGIRLDGHGLFSTAQIGQGATGILYLGNQTAPAYLYWDGGSYAMPSGPLLVNGSTVWTAATFDPAAKANAVHSHDWAQVTGKPALLSQVASIDYTALDTAPAYGITTVGYPGYSKTLLAFNPGGSVGQVQQEFNYLSTNAGYWRIRNKLDQATWQPWKHVLLHDDATAPLSGTIYTSTNLSTSVPALEAQLFNNGGVGHGTIVPGFGARFFFNNGPNSAQAYGMTLGLGSNYAATSYSIDLAVPRAGWTDHGYLHYRSTENGSVSAWAKAKTGYADSAGSLVGFDPASKFNTSGGTISGVTSIHRSTTANDTYHLELSRADSGNAADPIYLRFHHHGRYYHRIRADNTGLSLVSGGDESLVALKTGDLRSNGSLVWTAATFDPASKANLSGATFTGNLVIHNASTFDARTSGINVHRPNAFGQYGSMAYDGDTTYFSSTYTGGGSGQGGAFVFQSYDNGGTPAERLRIARGTGNVGMGTTDPAEKLHIKGNNAAMLVETASDPSTYRFKLVANYDWSNPFTLSGVSGTNVISQHNYHVRVGNDSGNVGIGTNDPKARLHISYANPVSVPAAGATGHAFAAGTWGYGLAAGVLTSGNSYIQSTRWDGGAANYPLMLQPNGGVTRVGDDLRFDKGRSGMVGVYDAAQTQAVWAMGPDFTLTPGGASNQIGGLYGLAWSYEPNYGVAGNNPQSKPGLYHQMLLMNNGTTLTALGAGIWTSGRVECAGNGGWTMGSYADKNRIDHDGSKFRFINSGNGSASVEVANLTANGNISLTGELTAAAGTVYTSGGAVYSNNWWRSTGTTGWFNASYSVGIWAIQTGEVRTYNGARFHSEGNLSSGGVVISGTEGGFQNAGYVSGRNRIWSFANSDAFGLSYYQGAGGWSGLDTINFHFGSTSEASAMHKFRMDGVAAHAGDLYVKGTRVPVFTSSTGAPSGGVDGDIHVTY